MSTDFWAGYASGAIGILVGNPMDIIKVRQQATNRQRVPGPRDSAMSLAGSAGPILGYGALNAILYVVYNRSEAGINQCIGRDGGLWSTWVAGAVGGLATWVVSTPTELVKCQAQVKVRRSGNSWDITKSIWQSQGIRGMFTGGTITALRDSIGYGFYFWSYKLMCNHWNTITGLDESSKSAAARTLTCGGIAGIVTWASVFPLDVIKTRVQTQPIQDWKSHMGAVEIAKNAIRKEGGQVLFKGFTICCARAFFVNAIQWMVYEYIMDRYHTTKLQVVEYNQDAI
ncbi:hypothetical protein VHEMI02901 [[Torrubiella] hemipterigena]|uniref:Mitochondrial carrier protein n=1 Tax=[Torrubiella] hemipterigena TaxID=1531966 RepID=A0A0A1SX03_9HYPO|nr:hypothetical protein VHEMI02901 [[Torrubiella] hemipterigena]